MLPGAHMYKEKPLLGPFQRIVAAVLGVVALVALFSTTLVRSLIPGVTLTLFVVCVVMYVERQMGQHAKTPARARSSVLYERAASADVRADA